jgi:GNAT superfamily N-acetyltransferase
VIVIESLDKGKHARLAFTCGSEPLDRFIHDHAYQAAAKGLSKTYVAVDESDESDILGYYTVTTCRIEAGQLPRSAGRALKLSAHELPASLVARLAVSESAKGRGIGSLMLMDAMARCARAAGEIGSVAVVVDALDEGVISFYEKVGFTPFEPGSRKMFIPMTTVRNIVGLAEPHRQAG